MTGPAPIVIMGLLAASSTAADGSASPRSTTTPAVEQGATDAQKPKPRKLKGSLSREEISRTVMAENKRYRACYERRLRVTPDLRGTLTFAWTIGPDGTVIGSAISDDTVGDEIVAACVLNIVRGLRFPRPRGGGKVFVTYPFTFSTSDEASKHKNVPAADPVPVSSVPVQPEPASRWYLPWTWCS